MTQSDKNKIAKALRSAYAFIEFKCKQDGQQDYFNTQSELAKQITEALDLVEPVNNSHAQE